MLTSKWLTSLVKKVLKSTPQMAFGICASFSHGTCRLLVVNATNIGSIEKWLHAIGAVYLAVAERNACVSRYSRSGLLARVRGEENFSFFLFYLTDDMASNKAMQPVKTTRTRTRTRTINISLLHLYFHQWKNRLSVNIYTCPLLVWNGVGKSTAHLR